jgi:hypothetical protein
MRNACQLPGGGSAPATPGFNAVAPEWFVSYGAAEAAPVIPAAESTLGSHPCVALSSAQVLPEWINRSLAGNQFAANGDNPLTPCLTPGVHFIPCPVKDLQGEAGAVIQVALGRARKEPSRVFGGSAWPLLHKAPIPKCMNRPPRLLQSKSIQQA